MFRSMIKVRAHRRHGLTAIVGIGGESMTWFVGGSEYVERSCVGMIVNEVNFEEVFNFEKVYSMYIDGNLRDFLFVSKIGVVFPDLEEDWREFPSLVDAYMGCARSELAKNGGEIVIRRGAFATEEWEGECASVDDGLEFEDAGENEFESCLCGAQFSFGEGEEMRVDVEMAAGSVLSVYPAKVEEAMELDESGDEAHVLDVD